MKAICKLWCKIFHFNRLVLAKHNGWNGGREYNIYQCKTCGFYFKKIS